MHNSTDVIGLDISTVVGTSREGLITKWSPGAEHRFGLSHGVAVGRPVGSLTGWQFSAAESAVIGRLGPGDFWVVRTESVTFRARPQNLQVTVTVAPDSRGHDALFYLWSPCPIDDGENYAEAGERSRVVRHAASVAGPMALIEMFSDQMITR